MSAVCRFVHTAFFKGDYYTDLNKKKVEKRQISYHNINMFGKRKKHQVRIQHQTSSSSKRNLLIFIFLIIAVYTFFNIYRENNPAKKPDTLSKNKKENPLQQSPPALIDKNIKKQIQEDYKTNLLKQKMAEDSALHKKNKYIAKEAPADSEDYTLKDGVNLSQDESFDNLLSILKTAEEETDEDIEDRIARYHIIEKQIQNFQGRPEENTKAPAEDPSKTYAQEFIENARKGGYEVRLDDNFKIKSVKKIKPAP